MRDAIFFPSNRFLWSLLAILAGAINTAGLLCVHRFVSHVTGFAGHFAEAVYDGNFLLAVYAISLPVSFLCGSAFSAFFTEARRKQGQEPVYIHAMSTIAFLLLLVGSAGSGGAFGEFGEPFANFRDFVLLAILSFCCGAQNALFTDYSGSIIRTTHLTGLTTDLGVGLVKEYWVKDKAEKKFNNVRIELILSFIVGSTIAIFLFKAFAFKAFFPLSALALAIAFRLYWTRTRSSH